jgi:RND superfamily putative drug exporter
MIAREDTPRRHDGALAALVRACAVHPWRTIGAWGAVVLAIVACAVSFGAPLVNEFTIPDSDAQRATDLLEERFPAKSGDQAQLVFAAPGGLEAPSVRSAVEDALAAAATVPGATEVGDLYAERNGELSDDGRIGFAVVQFDRQAWDVPREDVEELKAATRAAVEGSPVTLEFTGPVIQDPPESGPSELLGLFAALIVLLVVFGTFVAALIPIGLALVAVGIGLALLTIGAAFTNFNDVTPILATMIGLGVGIDYALFIVTRFRQSLHDGHAPVEAATIAGATSGRAVIFAGTTVAISISGLVVIGLDFITKLGFGASITVLTSVLLAVTLLPAALSLLGDRIDRLKVPLTSRRDDSREALAYSKAARWGRLVTRHPWPFALGVSSVLLVLAIPALVFVQLGASDNGTAPKSTTVRKAYDLLAEGFGPGFNGPLLVAVDLHGDAGAAEALRAELQEVAGVARVPAPALNDAGDTALLTVYPETSPQSQGTQELVERLRGETVPAALAGSGARAYVGGLTAAFDDIADRIFERFGLFLLTVIGITFVVLAMAFRSVVIALLASLTTILSVLAAGGILVLVFQEGLAMEALGLDRTGPIESFLPVIVFAILFGLSMDYMVFLGSRIREEYVHGDSAYAAIRHGVASIGRVIMAAATIMAVVFFAFLLNADRVTKEFGLALGAAILIDAFFVRLTLVPALLWLLGEKAWYIPGWLDRLLPRVTIESPLEGGDADAGERPAPAST